jgi:hypothetical protein
LSVQLQTAGRAARAANTARAPPLPQMLSLRRRLAPVGWREKLEPAGPPFDTRNRGRRSGFDKRALAAAPIGLVRAATGQPRSRALVRAARVVRHGSGRHRPRYWVQRDARSAGRFFVLFGSVHRRRAQRRAFFSVTMRMDPRSRQRSRLSRKRPGRRSVIPARSGITSWPLGLRCPGSRGGIHRLHLEERPGHYRPADRPPGPRPQPHSRRRAG